MPTLLNINNYFYRRGGAEVVFLEQNRLFEAIGWQVVPFAMKHAQNNPSQWQGYFVDEIEFGVSYSLWQKIQCAAKIIYSMEARQKIASLSAQIHPDIAHAHNVYHHISPSIFSKLKKLGIPTVLTLHDLKIACPAYKMLTHDGVCERCKNGALWQVVSHRCVKDSTMLSAVIMVESVVHRLLGSYANHVDRFVTPSRFCLEKFVEWGWSRERFTYIPNFVDVNALRPEGKPGQAFVYCGRLGAEKGLATFIRAVAQAGVSGWIVGTGPDENELRQLALSLNANINFWGYRNGAALFEVLRQARALVLPSELYENAPMSVMEAYALERPVIGAAIGGIPELIRIGETGAIFASGNVEALATQLRHYAELSTDEIWGRGKAGRAWMQADFTAERYRDRLLDLYRSMGVKT